MPACEKRHIGLREDERVLLGVLVIRAGLGVSAAAVAKLADDAAKGGILSGLYYAAKMHTHFGRVVASEHGAVVHQSHAATQAGRRYGCTHAGDAATDDNEVELLGLRLLASEQGETPVVACSKTLFGRTVKFGGEQYGIHAAVEAGLVCQRYALCALLEPDHSAVLPLPAVARAAHFGSFILAAHAYAEASRTFCISPRRSPVVRAHPHAVTPVFGHRGGSLGVGHGHAHAMSNEVRRPHKVHELLVYSPSALVCKRLGLDEHVGSERSVERQQCDKGNK